MMIAFLDTEFTDLVIQPRLLSVGLVAGTTGEAEFYGEVTDTDRIHASSWFALSSVLPQFGKVPNAACTYAALGGRRAKFLGDLTDALIDGDRLDIAFGYHLDWELIEAAISDSGAQKWESTRRRIRPVNVYDVTGFGAGELAAETYLKSQAEAPLSRHHALCDARALRMAYQAACHVGRDVSAQTFRQHAATRQDAAT
jgi:hypothetical protein